MVSLDSLQGLGGWFNATVSEMDDSSRAVVGGWAASLTLSVLQMLTPNPNPNPNPAPTPNPNPNPNPNQVLLCFSLLLGNSPSI